ncbi:MAG: hypothetical protein ACYC64_13875 [Armatimonadota bacterium]
MLTLRRLLTLVLLLFLVSESAMAAKAVRIPYLPVTFTQMGWRNQGRSLIYSSWRYAFYNFTLYGRGRRNWLYAGGIRTMSIEGSTTGLTTLVNWFPQTDPSVPLTCTQDYIIPVVIPHAGRLAGEVVALTMNVAFNDMRLMPRQTGYDLEEFVIASGPFKRCKVGYIWDIGNRVLGGEPPSRYGLPDYETLANVIAQINANYEFINLNTFIDRRFLIPNRSFGRPARAHYPHCP